MFLKSDFFNDVNMHCKLDTNKAKQKQKQKTKTKNKVVIDFVEAKRTG